MSLFWHFILVSTVATTAAATVAYKQCVDPLYNVRTCCRNQEVHIDKYNGDFLAYVCDYKHNAYLDPNGGWYCINGSVDVCCNMKDGYIAPIRGGYEHTEPSNFRCDGLSGLQSDDGPLTSISASASTTL